MPTALGDDHRVEHERRELARADPARDDVVAADPQDDADRAEHEHDHRRDQQRALADPRQRGRERGLDALAEAAPVLRLVAVGLHGADLVQRLVDVGADVADAVLARAREPAHAAAEEEDRHDHQRHAGQHEQRELGAGDREHHEPADQQQQVADRHRRARADDGLEHRRVVGEPRDHVAGARDLEEARRQRQQVIEHRAPQIGGDALADPRHEVEARERRHRHHDDDAEHQRERAVELAGVAGARSRGR